LIGDCHTSPCEQCNANPQACPFSALVARATREAQPVLAKLKALGG
jgi:hypothetical protein